MDGDQDAAHVPRDVMSVKEAAALLGISEQSVRRWIDENEPDAEHPDRVPVAERARKFGGPVAGRWRKPFRDAVVAEARRRRGVPGGAGDQAARAGEQDPPAGDVTLG